MAKQLGIVWRENDGRTVHDRSSLANLFQSCLEEMLRVIGCTLARRVRIVDQFRFFAADSEILDARETAVRRRREVRLHVVEIQVEADVPIEIAIPSVSRIPLVLAPDLFSRIDVPP